MNKTFKLILITTFCISIVTELHSQNSNLNTKKNAWITIFNGKNWGSENKFRGGGVVLSYSSNKLVFSGRYLVYNRDKQYDPFEADGLSKTFSPSNLEKYSEFSALIGYIFNKRFFKFMASSCLGYNNWISENDKKKHSIVVPIDIGIIISPLPVLGIGFNTVSSINNVYNLNGFLVSIEFGKLW